MGTQAQLHGISVAPLAGRRQAVTTIEGEERGGTDDAFNKVNGTRERHRHQLVNERRLLPAPQRTSPRHTPPQPPTRHRQGRRTATESPRSTHAGCMPLRPSQIPHWRTGEQLIERPHHQDTARRKPTRMALSSANRTHAQRALPPGPLPAEHMPPNCLRTQPARRLQ
jgi:hypothetical protein